MQKPVLKTNRKQVESLIDGLQDPTNSNTILKDVKRMLMIKQRIALENEVGC